MKPVEKNLPRTRVDLSETNQLASMPCIVAVGVHRAWFLYVYMSSCFTSAYGEMRYLQQMSWKVMETKSPKRDIYQPMVKVINSSLRGPPHPPVGPGVSQLSDLSIASGGGASAVGHQHLWELHGHTDLSNRCGHEGAKKKNVPTIVILWEVMGVNGCEWVWMGVNGCEWELMGVNGGAPTLPSWLK